MKEIKAYLEASGQMEPSKRERQKNYPIESAQWVPEEHLFLPEPEKKEYPYQTLGEYFAKHIEKALKTLEVSEQHLSGILDQAKKVNETLGKIAEPKSSPALAA